MKRLSGIYRILNKVNGKGYVGSAYPTSVADSMVPPIVRWRVVVASGPTTFYLKGACGYTGATPKFYGYISAEQVA